jgi:hypothetical protein
MISTGSTYREKVETTARARVFWGDTPDDVIKELTDNGLVQDEAKGLVEEFVRERAHTIRSMGSKKIFIGLALVALPLLPWIALTVMLHRFFMPPLMVLCVPGSVFVYGAYSLFKGIFMYFLPYNETGDVAEVD